MRRHAAQKGNSTLSMLKFRTVLPRLRPHMLRICRLLNLCLILTLAAGLLPMAGAQAGIVYRLDSTQALPGASVDLRAVLYNDTGNRLTTPTALELRGQWVDTNGHAVPAHFELRTSPDRIDLPANTFAQMIWSGQVPAGAHGLLSLQLDGVSDTLLALQVGAPAASAVTGPPTIAATPEATSAPTSPTVRGTAAPSGFETFRNAISPYEPVYFVAGNQGGANARFQVSLKYRLFSPSDASQPGLLNGWYLGYTQTNFWDLHSDSIPFIDTTYNPSVFWSRDALLETHDRRGSLGLNAGLEHKSNGKGGADSRSMNDLYLQPEFNYRFGHSVLSFTPRLKHYIWTDSGMRYPDSLGYVDWKLRWAQDDGPVVSGLYRQGSGSRNATQLEVAWPLRQSFLALNGYLYLQYFRGYGETLLDYNQKHAPQLRLGIALIP